jgi:N-succinyldiaminopimelate aminotransferase
MDAAVAAIRAGHNQYPPGIGVPELRRAIADHQARHYGIELDPDRQVIVTTGATEGIAAALLALAGPGDEVVTFEPYYDSYAACIAMGGATRRVVTLRPPDYGFDPDELEAAVTPATKVMLVNSPHNPTGVVLSREQLEQIASVCRRHDLIAVTDEVYEHLTFDGREHIPLSTLPGMFERTLTISSAGKTFSFTGWKVGWACAPPDLVTAVNTAKQFLSFTSGAPFQPAIAHALGFGDDYYESLRTSLQDKRDRLCAGLADVGLEVYRPEGTYFVTTDIRSLGFDDGVEFCRSLPERCGVVAVPHEVFYDHAEMGRPLVRWAFCKRDNVLDEAVTRLRRGLA